MTKNFFNILMLVPIELVRDEKEWLAFKKFVDDLSQCLSVEAKIEKVAGHTQSIYEVVLAFISGGALVAAINSLYQIIQAYLSKHQGRELTFWYGDKKITLKGRSAKEEMELLKTLFPESIDHSENCNRDIKACLGDQRITLLPSSNDEDEND